MSIYEFSQDEGKYYNNFEYAGGEGFERILILYYTKPITTCCET